MPHKVEIVSFLTLSFIRVQQSSTSSPTMISILGYDPENGIKSINTSRVPFARYLLPTALRKDSTSHKHSNIEIAFNSHKNSGETTNWHYILRDIRSLLIQGLFCFISEVLFYI